MIHTAESNWTNGMHFETNQPGGKLNLDADEIVGGNNLGLRPKPLMLSAIAGCTAMDVTSLFKKMRAEPDGFKILVSGELTDEHPKYYHSVKIEYHFFGKGLKKDKLEKAVDLSVTRYCGVIEMFRHFAKVETAIHYFEEVPAEA